VAEDVRALQAVRQHEGSSLRMSKTGPWATSVAWSSTITREQVSTTNSRS